MPLSGSLDTAADGSFVFCEPPGTPFTLSLAASGYTTMYRPEMQANVDGDYAYMGLISNDFAGVLQGFGVNLALGTVIVLVEKTNSCPDASGWTISLSDADGGSLPDGGYQVDYLGTDDLPVTGLGNTSAGGTAIVYGINLSATNFFHVSASKPDAGACMPVFDTAFLTGRVYVTTNAIATLALQMPN